MAYSTTKRSLCKECNKAPSVFFCQGCQKDFCTDHAKEHRQELSKQLDTIIVEHDQLQQNLAEFMEKSSCDPLMKQIDQWETESIDKIRKAAEDARKRLSNVVSSHTTNITKDLKQLSQVLTTAQSENNFIEIDLKEWMEKLEKWTKDLSKLFSISIQEEKNDRSFIQNIVIDLKKNEFFEKMAGKIKIEDNGQVITVESTGHSTARCQGDYSFGQHKFRFKIEQKDSHNWMHFGIVSQNVPLQKTSCSTPKTFGWITDGCLLLNGSIRTEFSECKINVIQNDILELFLDCDQRKISLTNERTNKKHELDVSVTQCPFPWQIHIGLYYQNDRIRCLPT
jgi:hypothetical protein